MCGIEFVLDISDEKWRFADCALAEENYLKVRVWKFARPEGMVNSYFTNENTKTNLVSVQFARRRSVTIGHDFWNQNHYFNSEKLWNTTIAKYKAGQTMQSTKYKSIFSKHFYWRNKHKFYECEVEITKRKSELSALWNENRNFRLIVRRCWTILNLSHCQHAIENSAWKFNLNQSIKSTDQKRNACCQESRIFRKWWRTGNRSCLEECN